MPKINSKVNSRAQQQRLRRMRERESDFASKFTDNSITCCSLPKLYRASETELTALIPILKKIIQHNSKVQELIQERCYTPERIARDEYNTGLFEHLTEKYKGVAGQKLKFKNSDKKDKFRETVIKENQLQFNNCLPREVENSIVKLFDSINTANFTPTEKFYEDQKKEAEARQEWVIPEVEEPEEIPEPPEPPTPTRTPLKPKKIKKIKKETKKIKKETTPPPVCEPDSESDSDIEEDIKKMEMRENTDQDSNTKDDLKQWRAKLNKLWKDDIEEHYNDINDDDDEDYNKDLNHEENEQQMIARLTEKYLNETQSIIKLYINKSKNLQNGTKAQIGKWTSRNPISLNKIITSIVKKIEKRMLKEL